MTYYDSEDYVHVALELYCTMLPLSLPPPLSVYYTNKYKWWLLSVAMQSCLYKGGILEQLLKLVDTHTQWRGHDVQTGVSTQ